MLSVCCTKSERPLSYFLSLPLQIPIHGMCSCTSAGFLVGERVIPGAVLAYRGLLTGWHVESMADITDDSLSIVDLLKPAPGMFVDGGWMEDFTLRPAIALHLNRGGPYQVPAQPL